MTSLPRYYDVTNPATMTSLPRYYDVTTLGDCTLPTIPSSISRRRIVTRMAQGAVNRY